MSLLAVNGFQLSTAQMSDDWFEDEPTQSEMSNWLNQLAVKFGKTYPNVNRDSAKPLELARLLAQMIYAGDAYADTLLSEADINYQLRPLRCALVCRGGAFRTTIGTFLVSPGVCSFG